MRKKKRKPNVKHASSYFSVVDFFFVLSYLSGCLPFFEWYVVGMEMRESRAKEREREIERIEIKKDGNTTRIYSILKIRYLQKKKE